MNIKLDIRTVEQIDAWRLERPLAVRKALNQYSHNRWRIKPRKRGQTMTIEVDGITGEPWKIAAITEDAVDRAAKAAKPPPPLNLEH